MHDVHAMGVIYANFYTNECNILDRNIQYWLTARNDKGICNFGATYHIYRHLPTYLKKILSSSLGQKYSLFSLMWRQYASKTYKTTLRRNWSDHSTISDCLKSWYLTYHYRYLCLSVGQCVRPHKISYILPIFVKLCIKAINIIVGLILFFTNKMQLFI